MKSNANQLYIPKPIKDIVKLEDLDRWVNDVALVAKDLIGKGLSIDEAVEIAPIEYEKRQRQFSRLFYQDDGFREAIINAMKIELKKIKKQV